jgi:hydrogenase nickel incorporation protein HypA/HybF
MHELSIACSLVCTASSEAERHGASRVTRLDVVVGALAGVEPASLSFCFPVAAAGTRCAGAELNLDVVPARANCPACHHEGEARDLMDACPRCGSWPLVLEGGREMCLRSMEVA